ncbi:MAG: helix-turn-helix domain-containing protein [Methanosarcinales archaeon]|nr:helix-turn-helix domain-containing protein [Methanosarcinales archaeon]
MQTVHKFRLYPTSEQEQSLLFVMKVCRWVYNQFLSTWNNAAKIPGRYGLQATLPELKKRPSRSEKSQLKNPSDGIIHALQQPESPP